MNQLIHCINCHAVFLKTAFDQGEEYEFQCSQSAEEFKSIHRDDFQDFLRSHRGHRLEDLRIVEDSYVSEKPYFEPVKVSYFKATNGKDSFVIKKFREKIDEPLRYQLIKGDYSLKFVGVEIQSEEIAKQLAREFKEAPLPPGKIRAFLKLFRHMAETIDIRNLERIPEESSHPLEIYYKLDDFSLVYLLRNCRNILEAQEYSKIETFIQHHKDNGVLLLKGTYEIEITERTQPVRKAVSAEIPIQNKKVREKI